MTQPRATGALLGLLAVLGVLGQFGSNVYLPGLPQIGVELRASPSAVSITYSLFLACFGVAQLAAGALTDRIGRRPVALHSTLLFVIASVLCALAPSLGWLIAGRVLQAVGAAGAIVASRAVARDRFEGDELVRVVTVLMMAFALVPGLSPLLGGAFTEWLGWRSTLWLCAALGLATWIWTQVALDESMPQTPAGAGGVLQAYRTILGNRVYLRMVLIAGIAFGGLLAFFGTAPRLYMQTLGVSPVEFGLYPPIALLGFFIGAGYLRRVTGRYSSQALLKRAALVQVAACLLMLVPMMFGWLSKWPLTIGLVAFVAGLGVLSPLASAAALNAQSSHVGQSSALMGFMQMLAGAVGAALGNLICDLLPIIGMQLSMLLLAILNVALVSSASRQQ